MKFLLLIMCIYIMTSNIFIVQKFILIDNIRKMIAKNFYIYFRIDESNHKVYILNIIYTKQDQLKRLNEMNI